MTFFAMLLVVSAVFVPALSAADGYAVTGIITDSITGAPVEGAEVRLTPTYYLYDFDNNGVIDANATDIWFEGYAAVTDSTGTFTLQVPEGDYDVTVYASGYELGYSYVIVYGDTTFTLSLFKVPPTDASIEVVVSDEATGEPVEGANVYLWPNYSWEQMGILGFPSYMQVSGFTDADGIFASGIWAGNYYLSVDAKGHEPYWGEASVATGDNLSVPVQLVAYPVPDATVEGYVYDLDTGLPLANCSVTAYPDWCRCGNDYFYWEPQYATTDASGHYSLSAVAGTVQLSLWADGYEGYWTSVNVPSGSAMRVDAALVPMFVPELVATLHGSVSSADGPVEGAYVEVWMYSDPYAKIAPAIGYDDGSFAGDWYGQSYYYWAYTGSDGSYSVGLPAGEASITVSAPGFYAQYSYMTIASGDYALEVSLEPTPLPDAKIAGAVVDSVTGLPVEGAYVYAYSYTDPVILYEENADRFSDSATNGIVVSNETVSGGYFDPYGYFYADAVTGPDGAFSLGVAGGDYSLDVWAEGYEYFSTLVTVESEATLEITVALVAGENGNRTDLLTPLKVIDLGMGSAPVSSDGSFEIKPGEELAIDLGRYFSDPDGDELTYTYQAPEGLDVRYDEVNGLLLVSAPEDYDGDESVTVQASDGQTTVSSHFVVSAEQAFPVWPLLGFAAAIVASVAVLAVLYVAQRE